jgi:membrane protease YdiL (CAAX protease family)
MRNVAVLTVALFLVCSLVLWWQALARWRAGQPLLTREPSGYVRWGLVDFLLAFFLYFAFTAVVSPAVIELFFGVPRGRDVEALTASQRTLLLSGLAAGSLLAFLVSNLLVQVLHRCSWQDRGWVASKWRGDVRLGIVAFVMLAPPVYGLQLLLTQYFESKHPLVEAIRDNPTLPLVLASGLLAVIAAPIVEEYLLRVLLQGWLEKLAASHEDPVSLTLGQGPYDHSAAEDATAADQPTQPVDEPRSDGPPVGTAADQPPMWPVFVSSLVFAAMHVAHGPDWIPLFVLAVGLGYLYRQTHRILPCIVVHFLLNACSFAGFVSSLDIQ